MAQDRCKNGLLIIDKSAGMTSFDVVRDVRKLGDTRKVGHTGTLDPDATGVLALALGRCTKLSKYLVLDEKTYTFTMKFGTATATDDDSGEVIRSAEWKQLTREAIDNALNEFVGNIDQVPPIYSAIKVDGERAYALARAGKEVDLDARPVTVHSLEITDWRLPEVDLRVRCEAGTYVRSLARDIGEALGSAAHTTQIRRLNVGPFSIESAVQLEDLTKGNFWSHVLSPMEMVGSISRCEIGQEHQRKVGHGQRIVVDGTWGIEEPVAAHDNQGKLVAVMECEKTEKGQALLRPKRVFT